MKVLGILFLVGIIGGGAWWYNTTQQEPPRVAFTQDALAAVAAVEESRKQLNEGTIDVSFSSTLSNMRSWLRNEDPTIAASARELINILNDESSLQRRIHRFRNEESLEGSDFLRSFERGRMGVDRELARAMDTVATFNYTSPERDTVVSHIEHAYASALERTENIPTAGWRQHGITFTDTLIFRLYWPLTHPREPLPALPDSSLDL